MRKFILLIVFVSLFCSCTPVTDKSVKEDITESVFKGLPLDSLEVYITYSGAAGYKADDIEYCTNELRNLCIEEMNTEVNIHSLPPYDTQMIKGYESQVKTLLNSGQQVDIYIATEGLNVTEMTMEKQIEGGLAADITTLVNTYYKEASNSIERFYDYVSENGVVYGIPIIKKSFNAYGMWMPEKLSSQIESISSYNDVVNILNLAMEDDYSISVDPSMLQGLWAAEHGCFLFETYMIDEIKNQVIPVENTDMLYDVYEVCNKLYSYPNLIKKARASQEYTKADCQIVYYNELGTYSYSFSSQYINNSEESVLRLINIKDAFYYVEEYRGAVVINANSQKKDRSRIEWTQ